MQAITIQEKRLQLSKVDIADPTGHQVQIEVAYAALNRADILQKQGLYPAPDDAPADIPGLEVAGTIIAVGNQVSRWQVGDKVCALLSGGGYSELVNTHEALCLPIPTGLSLKQAAALPECNTTVWSTIFKQARLQPNESVLVHGGSSGIGTTAIQMLRAFGHQVFVTAGTDEKCDACSQLGALAINYNTTNFMSTVKDAGGVDVVLDMVGGDYVEPNLKCLRKGGRMISIACLKGPAVSFNMGGLLMKGLQWTGSTLRSRSLEEKARFIEELEEQVWPHIASGSIQPIIDSEFALKDAELAQEKMEKSLHIGKILLKVGG